MIESESRLEVIFLESPKTASRQERDSDQLVLSTAWKIVQDADYQAVTMDAVAISAKISKNALYHKWPDRAMLVTAAFAKYDQKAVSLRVPNGGHLERDFSQLFAALLPEINELSRPKFAGLVTERLEDVPVNQILSIGPGKDFQSVLMRILKRADKRHQIQLNQLSENVLNLPALLLVNQIILGKHVTKKDLDQLITEILLPVYTASKIKWI